MPLLSLLLLFVLLSFLPSFFYFFIPRLLLPFRRCASVARRFVAMAPCECFISCRSQATPSGWVVLLPSPPAWAPSVGAGSVGGAWAGVAERLWPTFLHKDKTSDAMEDFGIQKVPTTHQLLLGCMPLPWFISYHFGIVSLIMAFKWSLSFFQNSILETSRWKATHLLAFQVERGNRQARGRRCAIRLHRLHLHLQR